MAPSVAALRRVTFQLENLNVPVPNSLASELFLYSYSINARSLATVQFFYRFFECLEILHASKMTRARAVGNLGHVQIRTLPNVSWVHGPVGESSQRWLFRGDRAEIFNWNRILGRRSLVDGEKDEADECDLDFHDSYLCISSSGSWLRINWQHRAFCCAEPRNRSVVALRGF